MKFFENIIHAIVSDKIKDLVSELESLSDSLIIPDKESVISNVKINIHNADIHKKMAIKGSLLSFFSKL